MRAIVVFALSAVVLVAAAPHSKSAPQGQPVDILKNTLKGERQALTQLTTPFYDALIAGRVDDAMKHLEPSFAIAEGKREFFTKRINELQERLGPAKEYQLLGRRSVASSERILTLYFATYHPLKPAIWELQLYKAPATEQAPARWMLTSLRFETERIFELIEGMEK